MSDPSRIGRKSLRALQSLKMLACSCGMVLCLSEFAAAQMCMQGGGGGAAGAGTGAGTGTTVGGFSADVLQAQQFLVQMQQMQAEAMRQQAMQMMFAAAQRRAGQDERTSPCDGAMAPTSSSERVAAIRDTGDRFVSQRVTARLRKEALAARIAVRDEELQRRRDRAAAGR